jgi:hypothetical protein
VRRDANATGFRNAFQPGGDIHAIPKDVAVVDHYVTEIDPDAELDPPLLRHVGIALSHAALDIQGTSYRIVLDLD